MVNSKYKRGAKTCLNCKYFQSFYDLYDLDDEEPTNQGRCNHPTAYSGDEEAEKKQDIAGVDAQGCKDWEK